MCRRFAEHRCKPPQHFSLGCLCNREVAFSWPARNPLDRVNRLRIPAMSVDTAVLLALPANVFESSDGYQPSKASVEVLRHRLLWLQRLHSGGGRSATLRVCRGTLDVDAARRAACRAAEIRICWRAQDTRGGSAKSGSLLASLARHGRPSPQNEMRP